jgi:hypothetical protein
MYHEGKRVLLLNASEEVIRTITWQRAVSLLFNDKAHAPYNFDHQYTILTGNGYYDLPSAIILEEFVNMPYRHILPTRKNIFTRDAYVCQYTGKKLNRKNATIDHVVPRSRGGEHNWYNVVTCDRDVNSRKGNRTPEEFGLQLRAAPFIPSRQLLVMNEVPEGLRKEWHRWDYQRR